MRNLKRAFSILLAVLLALASLPAIAEGTESAGAGAYHDCVKFAHMHSAFL